MNVEHAREVVRFDRVGQFEERPLDGFARRLDEVLDDEQRRR